MSTPIADDPSQWSNRSEDKDAGDSARRIGHDRNHDDDDYDTLRYELESVVDGEYDDLLKQGESGIARLKRAVRGTLRSTPKRMNYRRPDDE